MRLVLKIIGLITLSFFITISTSAEAREEIELSNGEVVEVLFEQRSNGYRFEVHFENGHRYNYERSDNIGTGGGSMDLTDAERDLAEEAIDRYQQIYGSATNSSSSSGNPVGILVILIGLLGAISPYTVWYLEIGWKFRDAEPSEFILLANRIGGIVISIIGLFILI